MKIQELLESIGMQKYKVILIRRNDDGNEIWDSKFSYSFDAPDWQSAVNTVKQRIPSFNKKNMRIHKVLDPKGYSLPLD